MNLDEKEMLVAWWENSHAASLNGVADDLEVVADEVTAEPATHDYLREIIQMIRFNAESEELEEVLDEIDQRESGDSFCPNCNYSGVKEERNSIYWVCENDDCRVWGFGPDVQKKSEGE